MTHPEVFFASGGVASPPPARAFAIGLAPARPPRRRERCGEAPRSFRLLRPGVKSLQLGVGRSVIVDLPQDATEIFVGDPKVANAVVRSARRLYVAAVANGQTTIFALAADGSKIAAIEVTVGRDIGELQELLNAALPGNDITVKTVADSIILMGSVASAGEAQKALDIASGFVGTSVLGGASNAPAAPAAGAAGDVDAGQRRAVGHPADRQGDQFARPSAASIRSACG